MAKKKKIKQFTKITKLLTECEKELFNVLTVEIIKDSFSCSERE